MSQLLKELQISAPNLCKKKVKIIKGVIKVLDRILVQINLEPNVSTVWVDLQDSETSEKWLIVDKDF